MNFDHSKVPEITSKITLSQLLIIDWNINTSKKQSSVYQNFGQAVINCFQTNIEQIKKYTELTFLYPKFTYHPKEAIEYFKKFCTQNEINHTVLFDQDLLQIKKGGLYFLVSDRTLANVLDQCSELGFEPGKDIGVISYNETPMKKYVKNGISVISTDFELMGQKAAQFVSAGKPIQFEVPTTLQLRASL